MSHEQPVDLPIRSDHLWSAFIEEVDDEDLFAPSSGPQPISHTTLQHVDDPDFVDHLEPVRALVPLFTDELNEDLGSSDSDNDSLPFLGDPEPENSLVKQHHPQSV